MKFLKALAVLAALVAAAAALRDHSLMESFKEGMKEFMEASKKMDDMLSAETRMDEKSREEIEDMLREDTADTDASVSKESEPGRDREKDEEDDDEDDLEEMFGRPIPGGGLFNFFSFGGTAAKPWYSGPNVCTTREEKTDNATVAVERRGVRNGFVILGSAHFSTCKHSPRKYTCTTISKNNGVTKTVTVMYECCHGFGRVTGKDGCQKVDTKPTLELISDIGADRFLSLVKSSALEGKFETENRTVFVPTDAAFERYEAQSNQVDTMGNAKAVETNDVMDMVGTKGLDDRDLVLNHLVSGLIDTSDFRNDLVMKSEAHGTLRINYFPGKQTPVVTVNCARINSTDSISTNAVIHTVDGVLTPVVRTVQEILERPEYSKFKAMLEEYGLWGNLSSADGSFTVLAVNNAAFDNGPRFENNNCVQKILKHHILQHTVCSHAATSGQLSALDLTMTWLALKLVPGSDGRKTLVFDSEVTAVEGRTDMMATNGVVHEVPDFVVPGSAKSVIEVLKSTNATRMIGYLEKAGLIGETATTPKLTLFVPSEEYLEDKREVLDAMDAGELRSLLRRHMATDPREDGESAGDDGCEVADSGLQVTNKNGQKLSIRTAKNVLSSFIGTPGKTTVECVPLLRFNGKACNGVMHEISGFIPDPNMTVYDIIQNRQDLRVLKRLMADTKLESELKSTSAAVTVLAPVDKAFEKMGRRNFEVLAADKDMADQVLRNHIIPEVICCSAIGTTSWPFTQSVKTMGMGRLDINGATPQRGHQHGRRSVAAMFSGAKTDKCDIVANNGVVHTVDSVILPAEFRGNSEVIIRRPYSDIILAGF